MAGFAWTLDISAPEGEDKAEFVDELIATLNFRGCTVNDQLSTVRGMKTESSKLSIIHLQKFPQLLFVVNKASLTYLESQKPGPFCVVVGHEIGRNYFVR